MLKKNFNNLLLLGFEELPVVGTEDESLGLVVFVVSVFPSLPLRTSLSAFASLLDSFLFLFFSTVTKYLLVSSFNSRIKKSIKK